MKTDLNIDELGVYELRELARKLGVKSPTTKKIGQLKQEIKLIQNGQMKGVNTNKIGRPPKSMSRQTADISAFFIPQDIASMIREKNQGFSEEELNLKKLIFRANVQSGDGEFANGYLRKTDANHFYFWSQTQNCFSKEMLVYITDAFAEEYSLRVGDFVQAKIEVYEENNYAIANKIIRVNGEQYEAGKRIEPVDLSKAIYPDVQMDILFGEKMNKGGRAIAVYDNRVQMTTLMSYAQNQAENGFRVLLCGCDIPPELFAYVENSNIELFVSRFGDGLQASYNTIINAINHAKSLACDHKDVIVVVYDTIGVLETMKMYFESVGQHQVNGVQLTKSIFGLGGNFGGVSSISTIACLLKNEYNEDFVQKELGKVASCVVGNY